MQDDDKAQDGKAQDGKAQDGKAQDDASPFNPAEPTSMPARDDSRKSSPPQRPKKAPRLEAPPRRKRSVVDPAPARLLSPPPREPSRRPTALTLATAGLFALLALGALTVFLLLPRWVEAPPAAGGDSATHVEADVVSTESIEAESPPVQASSASPRREQNPVPVEAMPASESTRPKTGSPTAEPPATEQRAGVSRVDALLADADDAALRRDWPAAEKAYARVLRLAPGHARATRGLERARAAQADAGFQAAMSGAFAALDEGRWQEAREALDGARALRPAAPEVAQALARVDEAERLEKLDRLRRLAETMEKAENWPAAARAYGSMLEIDPHLQVAIEGREKAEALVAIYERLAFHLENPGRLSDGEVLREAEAVLSRAEDVPAPGAELRRRIAELDELVAGYAEPVVAELRSDAETIVTIYRVGRLGRFESRRVELRPGSYTVHGSRPGYRDVRLELRIEPGETPPPLDVRCEESL